MILLLVKETYSKDSFPRRCGGDPIGKAVHMEEMTFSPQVRGVILGGGAKKIASASFPRRCGGDPPTDEIYVIDRASSRNNRGEPCLWHSHKSIRFFQKMRLLFQDISEWCN